MPLFEGIKQFENVSPGLQWAIFIVGALILVVALFSIIISIWLSIKYIVYNRTMNKTGINGKDAARKILDKHGLEKIKISVVGSALFGNSYSHFFKKIRLRRFTVKKNSISSLAMGAQKSALAILDKEGDKDMRTRIILTPITFFGPFMFVPIIIVGVLLDIIFFNFTGVVTLVAAAIGIGFFVLSFILSLMVLKTETKAQARALKILEEENLATAEEREMMKSLFKLYNIEYVNDLILEFLEIVLRILLIVARVQNSSSSSSSSN